MLGRAGRPDRRGSGGPALLGGEHGETEVGAGQGRPATRSAAVLAGGGRWGGLASPVPPHRQPGHQPQQQQGQQAGGSPGSRVEVRGGRAGQAGAATRPGQRRQQRGEEVAGVGAAQQPQPQTGGPGGGGVRGQPGQECSTAQSTAQHLTLDPSTNWPSSTVTELGRAGPVLALRYSVQPDPALHHCTNTL